MKDPEDFDAMYKKGCDRLLKSIGEFSMILFLMFLIYPNSNQKNDKAYLFNPKFPQNSLKKDGSSSYSSTNKPPTKRPSDSVKQ